MPLTPAAISRALSSISVRGWISIALVAVSAVLYAISAYQSRFYLSNVDGISYISIGRQYAGGMLDSALNAYWSPAVSWAIVPFLWMGIDEIVAFMIVNAIAAFVGTAVGAYFVWRFSKKNFWATTVFTVSAIFFFVGNLPTLTPDTMVVAWTIMFAYALAHINEVLDPGTLRQRIVGAVILGVLCAIGYFTKLFLLPVFVLTILVWLAIRWFSTRSGERDVPLAERLRRWALPPVATLIVFAVVSAPWIGAISLKYGEFTAGSSFSVNIGQKFDPDAAAKEENKDPLLLASPPNDDAVSFGEDRTFQVEGDGFESASSPVQRITHYVGQRIKGFPWYMQKVSTIAPVAVVSMSLFLLALVFGLAGFRRHRPMVMSGILWGSYFLGYAGVASAVSEGGNIRYMWPLMLLSVMTGAALIPGIWEKLGTNVFRKIVVAVLVAVVPLAAVIQHGTGYGYPFSPRPTASKGWDYMIGGKSPATSALFADQLEADGAIPADSRIAGSNYRLTLRLAYYLESHVYGSAGRKYDITNPAFQSVLDQNGIQYWVQYTPVGQTAPDYGDYPVSVRNYEAEVSCSDDKGATPEPCSIDILTLRNE